MKPLSSLMQPDCLNSLTCAGRFSGFAAVVQWIALLIKVSMQH